MPEYELKSKHMSKLTDRIKNLTPTEWLLIGTVIILIVLIIRRWDWISKEASEAFSNIFKPRF